MNDTHYLIGAILAKYPELSPEEDHILKEWLKDTKNMETFQEMNRDHTLDEKLQRMERITNEKDSVYEELTRKITHRRKTRIINWWSGGRMVAAASIIFVLVMGGYLWYQTKNANHSTVAKTVPTVPVSNDVNPGSFKAKLVMSDGSSVILDKETILSLTQEGNTKIINKDGQLTYINESSAENKASKAVFNTLETAKGQMFSVIFSDGSKAWLNSGSSLKYPVAFTGDERKVFISGEAYFEVTKSEKPFIVSSLDDSDWKVQVLGTHFNINSYADEQAVKTTLLEGKVKMKSDKAEVLLTPGQQAQLSRSKSKLTTTNNVDVEQVTAWKNGNFKFNNADLKTVMRQIARWYDVDISYEGQLPEKRFTGTMSRNLKASEVLSGIEFIGVHFKIERKKIVVLP